MNATEKIRMRATEKLLRCYLQPDSEFVTTCDFCGKPVQDNEYEVTATKKNICHECFIDFVDEKCISVRELECCECCSTDLSDLHVQEEGGRIYCTKCLIQASLKLL